MPWVSPIHVKKSVPSQDSSVLSGELRDLGLVGQLAHPKCWTLHEAEAMVTGPDGALYLGERGLVAHLMRCRLGDVRSAGRA